MSQLIIEANRWYGWQMIPGYVGERCIPYCCPIYVQSVEPLKSGKGILKLSFWNTGYAQGAQDFCLDLKVINRSADYLIAQVLDGAEEPDRCAVVSHIEFGWIEKLCPCLLHNHPPHRYGSPADSSVSIYLDTVFGI